MERSAIGDWYGAARRRAVSLRLMLHIRRTSAPGFCRVVVTVKTCAREKLQGNVGKETGGCGGDGLQSSRARRPGRRFRRAEPKGIR